jgi:hypothetical protein
MIAALYASPLKQAVLLIAVFAQQDIKDFLGI